MCLWNSLKRLYLVPMSKCLASPLPHPPTLPLLVWNNWIHPHLHVHVQYSVHVCHNHINHNKFRIEFSNCWESCISQIISNSHKILTFITRHSLLNLLELTIYKKKTDVNQTELQTVIKQFVTVTVIETSTCPEQSQRFQSTLFHKVKCIKKSRMQLIYLRMSGHPSSTTETVVLYMYNLATS